MATGSSAHKLQLQYYSQNITVWGPTSRNKSNNEWKQYDVLGISEIHRDDARANEVISALVNNGWQPVVSPSRPRDHIIESGGVALAARKHLRSSSYRHLAAKVGQCIGAP